MNETFPFVEHSPYLGIFLLLVLGTLGCPFPEDTTLMLSGFLVTRNVIRLIPALTVVYPTLLLTNLFLYGLGRRYGRRILEHRRFKKVLSMERLGRIEEGFGKWGIWLILTGRQLPVFQGPGIPCLRNNGDKAHTVSYGRRSFGLDHHRHCRRHGWFYGVREIMPNKDQSGFLFFELPKGRNDLSGLNLQVTPRKRARASS